MSTDWPAGYGRCVLDRVDSTNLEAARRAPGLSGPQWVLARRQTAARGRRGRAWHEPEGNFSATLILPTQDAPHKQALRSFVAALALFDALVVLCGRAEPFTLKWPNDVLLNGGKLSGILLEGAGAGMVLIGIGINLRTAPAHDVLESGAVNPVSLMGETGIAIAPEEMLDVLAGAYAMREQQFVEKGFGPIRKSWLERAARLGQEITARVGNSEIRGIFQTVDEQGQLVLSTTKGRRAIPAADVFFR